MILNHVEISVPMGTFTEQYCQDLDAFLCGILGWSFIIKHEQAEALSADQADTARMYYVDDDHFVVIKEKKDSLRAGREDHLGLKIDSKEELDHILDQCLALAAADERAVLSYLVDGKAGSIEVDGRLYSGFYMRYLLPLEFDIQTVARK